MVVWVDGLFAAHGAAEDLNGAIRDDFVGVHVRLCARAGLPDNEGKMVEKLEGGHFRGCLFNGFAKFGVLRAVSERKLCS